ncbi:hypothetical protein SCHPADRAFT_922813 [Schizopora paradoxa]|uniref:Uncharacterized protein n=1 Tax=Schizopora paradoxa TaxID=27342 RepID=A0A0H2RS33_9AGAM|nr:hypothetical protein SCHPADRAFT_922813 [Schizopora paradoxa]
MAYQGGLPGDFVTGDQHRYVLQNFRIAHEKVEQQRIQLQEQEKQVSLLRTRIATLEGQGDQNAGQRVGQKQGGTSVDDWSIKNSASKLEKLINRWAADTVRAPPAPLGELRDAALSDIINGTDPEAYPGGPTPMIIQNLLRHAMAESISEGFVNCLIVTSSSEANDQLTRIHEHLFARDPTVACVWRRQTFSAAVENCPPELMQQILQDNIPTLAQFFTTDKGLAEPCTAILDAAHKFSRMLHGSNSSSGGVTDTFYRAFVPELGSVLLPRQIELIKRCMKAEANVPDRVGATVFPGLVKVSKGADGSSVQTVVRRAQVICECALTPAPGPGPNPEEFAGPTN